MKTIACIKVSLLILSTVFFFSCVGPEGPEGPAGLDGNANVKSVVFDVLSGDWLVDGNFLYVDLDVDIITDVIASYGAVLVYYKSVSESNTWQMLPYTWPDGDYTEIMRFWYKPYTLTLEIYNPGGPLMPDQTYRFKCVAIEDFYAMSEKSQKMMIEKTTKEIMLNEQ
jgi:hypothetical protein